MTDAAAPVKKGKGLGTAIAWTILGLFVVIFAVGDHSDQVARQHDQQKQIQAPTADCAARVARWVQDFNDVHPRGPTAEEIEYYRHGSCDIPR